LTWTSGYWAPIASQAAIQAVQAVNRIVVADMQTNKANITEWTSRPPFRLDEEEADDEDDDILGGHLDRL
jgi:hypothetical protein